MIIKLNSRLLVGYLVLSLFVIFLLRSTPFSISSLGIRIAVIVAFLFTTSFMIELVLGKGVQFKKANLNKVRNKVVIGVVFSPVVFLVFLLLSSKGFVNLACYVFESPGNLIAQVYPRGKPMGRRKFLRCSSNTWLTIRGESLPRYFCADRRIFSDIQDSQESYGDWVTTNIKVRSSRLGVRVIGVDSPRR